jgi:hypothetical protein
MEMNSFPLEMPKPFAGKRNSVPEEPLRLFASEKNSFPLEMPKPFAGKRLRQIARDLNLTIYFFYLLIVFNKNV